MGVLLGVVPARLYLAVLRHAQVFNRRRGPNRGPPTPVQSISLWPQAPRGWFRVPSVRAHCHRLEKMVVIHASQMLRFTHHVPMIVRPNPRILGLM